MDDSEEWLDEYGYVNHGNDPKFHLQLELAFTDAVQNMQDGSLRLLAGLGGEEELSTAGELTQQIAYEALYVPHDCRSYPLENMKRGFELRLVFALTDALKNMQADSVKFLADEVLSENDDIMAGRKLRKIARQYLSDREKFNFLRK